MPTRSVNLTEHFSQFVDELVATGQYENASEVLGAGLRLLEQSTVESHQREQRLRVLTAEGLEQLNQGEGVILSTAQDLKDHIAAIGRNAAEAK